MAVKAEEFNGAVQVVRDWLPQAEAELKFRTIPEGEEEILQMIENHEVLINSSVNLHVINPLINHLYIVVDHSTLYITQRFFRNCHQP